MKKSKIIAIIPARGGSKRLKNKNILPLAGKPMIVYTIESAIDSKLFDEVLVSTDSEQIAQVARKYGAVVPFLRDRHLADDHTPVSLATVQALKQMEKHTGSRYDTVVQLMPNCPCRSDADIRGAYKEFLKTRANFQISIFPFGWMNPWWAMRVAKDGKPAPLFPQAYKKRSQDLEKLFCPTGAIWIADAAALKKEQTFYGKDFRVFPLDWQSAVDIDDREDLHMAQAVLRMKRN
jgi:N-acylneuraminate cytidylyltransferase